MASWRKCVFGCEKTNNLFTPSKEEDSRQKWLDFVFGSKPQTAQSFFVCEKHFTPDCFSNLGQFQSGFSTRLTLKSGAIPTLLPSDGQTPPGTSQDAQRQMQHSEDQPEAPPVVTPPVKSVGVQISHSSVLTRSVSTQLSAGTLRLHHLRSKASQARPATLNKYTETQQGLYFTFTQIKAATSGQRPSKRPRLEEEEEEDVEDMDISDAFLPRESTYEPGDSTAASTTATSFPEESEVSEPSALEEDKYIVFERSLKELFDTCPVCKHRCKVTKRKYGTFVAFQQNCPHCQYSRKWQSGPVIGSTPVGNLQFSAAVYFSGASFATVTKVCNAMNLKIHKYNTFRRHSRCYLEPAIVHKWIGDQNALFEELKKRGKVAVSGDMRADSPGHCAKYGSYILMDVHSEKILDIKLVQRNKVGRSCHMEKEGLRRGLDFLEAKGLEVDYIVTDRHPQIKKYLQDRDTTQYYGVWHVVKGFSKKLDALAKNKDCQLLQKWSAAIKNHMYWTASSSKSGPEKVAKWTSLLNHIQDVHTHDDPLYPKCLHPHKTSRDPNKWFRPGTVAVNKVKKLLMNKTVLTDVAKLSSSQQTSPLKSFHSLILKFATKSSDFKFVGMMCRLYLAGMHQNENAKLSYKVSYPKYKKGQGTAKVVKTKPTFGYVAALMRLVSNEVFPDPSSFVAELKAVHVPEDLVAQYGRAPAADVSRFSRAEAEPGRCNSRRKAHVLSPRIRELPAVPQRRTCRNDHPHSGSKWSPAPAHKASVHQETYAPAKEDRVLQQ